MLEPDDTFIGTLNEDFAIESMPGDVFQLGNTSWRILRVSAGVVRVADAQGQPPSMPFWLGEAPARSDELSRGGLRRCGADDANGWSAARGRRPRAASLAQAVSSRAPRPQIVAYLAEAQAPLGVVPTQDTLIAERFFDESGGMQLVLHAPFGSRVNRAWGLALRKKFCQGFNFELQAAATEDGVILSLGPPHSFPLEDVFRYLHPNTVRETLVQAVLDSPMFETRWRWNATTRAGGAAQPRRPEGAAAAPAHGRRRPARGRLPRRGGVPRQHPGRARGPRPSAGATRRCDDCLLEAMDLDGLIADAAPHVRRRDPLHRAATPEPSRAGHELLNSAPVHVPRRRAARGAPHAGGVHAPRERAVATPTISARSIPPRSSACARKRGPRSRTPTSCTTRCSVRIPDRGEGAAWPPFMTELAEARRAVRVGATGARPASGSPRSGSPTSSCWRDASAREPAVRELVRGRMESADR